MNILLLCDEYPPGMHGGIGTSVRTLAREFVRQGHQVIVAGFYLRNYGEADFFLDEGVIVYRYRYGLRFQPVIRSTKGKIINALLRKSGILQVSISFGLVQYVTFLKKLIKKYQIDVCEMPDFQGYMPNIIKYTPFPYLPVATVVKLHGTLTYFAREEGKQPGNAVYESERQILLQATAIASVSSYTANLTGQYFDLDKKAIILYNGINIPTADYNQAKLFTVIYTGSLVAKKGIFQLMKAWNIVSTAIPDVVLHIYGKGLFAPVAALLSTTARQQVCYHGHTRHDELLEALATAQVAVFPSYSECFAMAPMEAMAMGTAVIYSTRSSGPELINDGKDGLLCDPEDTRNLAQKIIFLLRNTHICNSLAEEGRKSVVRRFAISKIAEQHIELYNTIL